MLNFSNLVRVSASRATPACLAVPTLSMFGTIYNGVSFCVLFSVIIIINILSSPSSPVTVRILCQVVSDVLLAFPPPEHFFFSLLTNISFHLTFNTPFLYLTNILFHFSLDTFYIWPMFRFTWPWTLTTFDQYFFSFDLEHIFLLHKYFFSVDLEDGTR